MPTALADPPSAPAQSPTAAAGTPVGSGAPLAPAQQPAARACAKCGQPLGDDLDWCLQCGTGGPDSLRVRTPTWRSAAVILTALAALVAGAGGAAYAALSKGKGKPLTVVKTVAQAPPVATPTTPTTPLPTSPSGTPRIGAPSTIKPVTPPKIPLTSTPTPTPSVPIVPTTGAGGSTPTSTSKSKAANPSVPVGEAHPEALTLDTNAASTYNPYNYAAANFGDPSLAIDGDASTGWTALVEPSVAPKMAEGVVVDLVTPRKLSALGLTTTTPGMTVQVYGANGEAPPTSITDPAWVALTPAIVAKKKHARIKLGGSTAAGQAAAKQAYRFVVLWISQAPASAVGTPEAPGHVSVNELELFPLKKG